MSHDHKACYADQAWHGTVRVQENVQIARDTHRLRFTCPKIAQAIVPGQFMMVRLPGTDDPLLGRPLAIYDTLHGPDGQLSDVDIVYLALGKMTRKLAILEAGYPLEIWGPLGNGFPPVETSHLIMVAGGIGYTPFLALAGEYLGRRRYGCPPRKVARAEKVTLCYGSRTADYLAGMDDFLRLGADVLLATDDGSAGHHGLVIDLIRPVVAQSPTACRIVACGPERMMEATAEVARQLGVPCQVSLETPMACGIGICFTCVAKVRDAAGGWDYRRTCVEGPVFDAEDIIF